MILNTLIDFSDNQEYYEYLKLIYEFFSNRF